MEEHPKATVQVTATVEDQLLRPVIQADLKAAMVYAYYRARVLKSDSEFLAQHGRLPRSLGILIAANEELGKTLLLSEALGFQAGEKDNWTTWWARVRNHNEKLIAAAEIDHLYLQATPEEVRGALTIVDFIVSVREWAYYSDYISGYLVSLDLLLEHIIKQGGQAVAYLGEYVQSNFELTGARIYALRRLVWAPDPAAELTARRAEKGPMPPTTDEDKRRQREMLQQLGIPPELATDPKEYDRVWRKWLQKSGYPLRP